MIYVTDMNTLFLNVVCQCGKAHVFRIADTAPEPGRDDEIERLKSELASALSDRDRLLNELTNLRREIRNLLDQ